MFWCLCVCSISFKRMTGHASRVFGVSYHPQNPNELISAGWDSTIQVKVSVYHHLNLYIAMYHL